MTTYNGHKNWNHWNVALWLGNDEGLYHLALDIMRSRRTMAENAAQMLAELQAGGHTHTPDGARYTVTTLQAAMSGLRS